MCDPHRDDMTKVNPPLRPQRPRFRPFLHLHRPQHPSCVSGGRPYRGDATRKDRRRPHRSESDLRGGGRKRHHRRPHRPNALRRRSRTERLPDGELCYPVFSKQILPKNRRLCYRAFVMTQESTIPQSSSGDRRTLHASTPTYWPTMAGKEKSPGGSAQPLEKAQNGQGNQRKSKPFPWIDFDPAWPDLAGFG